MTGAWATCLELISHPLLAAPSAGPGFVQIESGCSPRLGFTSTSPGRGSAKVLELLDTRLCLQAF